MLGVSRTQGRSSLSRAEKTEGSEGEFGLWELHQLHGRQSQKCCLELTTRVRNTLASLCPSKPLGPPWVQQEASAQGTLGNVRGRRGD